MNNDFEKEIRDKLGSLSASELTPELNKEKIWHKVALAQKQKTNLFSLWQAAAMAASLLCGIFGVVLWHSLSNVNSKPAPQFAKHYILKHDTVFVYKDSLIEDMSLAKIKPPPAKTHHKKEKLLAEEQYMKPDSTAIEIATHEIIKENFPTVTKRNEEKKVMYIDEIKDFSLLPSYNKTWMSKQIKRQIKKEKEMVYLPDASSPTNQLLNRIFPQ